MAKEPSTSEPASEPAETINGQVATPGVAESFIQYLARRAAVDGENRSFDVAHQQVSNILVAETAEAMWDADERESVGGRNLVDVEQRIESYTVHQSSEQYSTALGHYFQITSTRLSDGETFQWDTSAPLLMGKIRWAEAHDMFPLECVIRATVAPKGNVLKLRPLPPRAAQGSKVE